MGIHDGHRKRKRSKFLSGGAEGLSDHELLEMLLFYAIPRRDTNELAHRLIEECGTLGKVLSAPTEQLAGIPGMGENAVTLLKLIPAVYGRICRTGAPEVILNSTDDAGAYFARLLLHERCEVVYEVCLDRKGKVIRTYRLSEGSVDQAMLDVRKAVENALLSNASAVLLAHNHPSGIALPSAADRRTTLQVRDALNVLGIELLDHIVVADGDFVSMAADGTLLLD